MMLIPQGFNNKKKNLLDYLILLRLILSIFQSIGPQVDQALEEAKRILSEISDVDFGNTKKEAEDGQKKAANLLEKMKGFAGPPDNMTEALEDLRERIYKLDTKFNDLLNHSQEAQANAHKAELLNSKNR